MKNLLVVGMILMVFGCSHPQQFRYSKEVIFSVDNWRFKVRVVQASANEYDVSIKQIDTPWIGLDLNAYRSSLGKAAQLALETRCIGKIDILDLHTSKQTGEGKVRVRCL